MKIFISWSGELSHKVAMVLREWLPCVLQTVEPYVSSEDIDKGTRWSSDIATELESSSFGIICVTPENLNAPWIHFEAGALSKIVKKSYVCPVLFGVKKSEVKGPLLQFQSTACEKEDVKKLVHTINSVCQSESLELRRLDTVIDMWWPRLEEELNRLLKELKTQQKSEEKEVVVSQQNESSEILEEILELTRRQQKILSSPDQVLPPDYIQYIFGKMNFNKVNMGALRALDRSLLSAKVEILERNEDEMMPVNEIKSLFEKIYEPAKYIIRNSMQRRHSVAIMDRDEVASTLEWFNK